MSNAPTSAGSGVEPAFDGAPGWRVRRRLRTGVVVVLRPIVPSDRAELARAFARLSPESRRARFFAHGMKMTDELLDYLTCVDQHDHVAIAAEVEEREGDKGVGVARLIRFAPGGKAAELSVALADEMQGHGLGSMLVNEMVRAARALGILTVRAEVLAANRAMRRVLERSGARPVEGGDAQTMVYELAVGVVDEARATHARRDPVRSAMLPAATRRDRNSA